MGHIERPFRDVFDGVKDHLIDHKKMLEPRVLLLGSSPQGEHAYRITAQVT